MVAPIFAGVGITNSTADISGMMPLMFGRPGIGWMRSFEKIKKTENKK